MKTVELLKGNLLVLLTLVYTCVFVVVWGKTYELPFQMVFIHYRKKNALNGYKKAGILIMATAGLCVLSYCVTCACIGYKGVSGGGLLFPMVFISLFYLQIEIPLRRNNILGYFAECMLWLIILVAFFGAILQYHMEFDQYCRYIWIGILLVDILLVRATWNHWMKGDL